MRSLFLLMVTLLTGIQGFCQDNWQVIKSGITEDLHDIRFLNDNVGFTYSYGSGTIYKTADQGQTWTKVKQAGPIYFEQMQFINNHTGWVCGEKGILLKTQDTGITWVDQSITITDGNLLLYGMRFLNDSIGFLSGAKKTGNNLTPVFYKSINGGNSWQEVLKDIPSPVINIDRNGYILYGSGDGFIIRLNYQSMTWKYVFRDTTGVTGQIRSVQFANEKNGIAVSSNGQILVSTDGGLTFAARPITTNRLRSVIYAGDNKWVAVGDNNNNDGGVLFTSADNGATWTKRNDFPNLHRISRYGNTIWVAGMKGVVAKLKKN